LISPRTPAYDRNRMSKQTARRVLEIEAQAIMALRERLDGSFDRGLDLLFDCQGRVVVSGMGKSGIIGQKLSATLASTGTPSLHLHPADAIHGDLGRVVPGDVVLAISSSGETGELLALVPAVKRLACPLIALTGSRASTLASLADVHLDVSIDREACPLGLAPTASTTAALAMGDALCMALLERRGFTVDDFAVRHPGGRLGRKLQRVEDLMHRGADVPRVAEATPMREVLFEMTRKRMGMTTVVDERARLVGVISDGDLRRQMQAHGDELLGRGAGECMTRQPVLVPARALATEALQLMEQRKITSLIVTDDSGGVSGVIHLHDLWKTEMI
jgi:arabinose-5-phosphate isomerase